ncbi:2TM domain-containing protein [Tenacibaculum geojense]|uniref:2TM domain-containing protein n=1 Tax=Tenacibaculum geojense TaxID=915352 RepID=A0ABW3JNV7_9FLAO
MNTDYSKEEQYLLAKQRVKKEKGFYAHFFWYVVVNVFLSGVIIFGLMKDNNRSFIEALTNFGTYSTWLFWGIGVFFHWLGVFGFPNTMTKNWEERKIKELMEKEEQRKKDILRK